MSEGLFFELSLSGAGFFSCFARNVCFRTMADMCVISSVPDLLFLTSLVSCGFSSLVVSFFKSHSPVFINFREYFVLSICLYGLSFLESAFSAFSDNEIQSTMSFLSLLIIFIYFVLVVNKPLQVVPVFLIAFGSLFVSGEIYFLSRYSLLLALFGAILQAYCRIRIFYHVSSKSMLPFQIFHQISISRAIISSIIPAILSFTKKIPSFTKDYPSLGMIIMGSLFESINSLSLFYLSLERSPCQIQSIQCIIYSLLSIAGYTFSAPKFSNAYQIIIILIGTISTLIGTIIMFNNRAESKPKDVEPLTVETIQ